MRYIHDNGYGHNSGSGRGNGNGNGNGGADPRLLRANDELRRVLQLIEAPSAKLLPRNTYEALERRMQRWSRVVESLILGDGRDAA